MTVERDQTKLDLAVLLHAYGMAFHAQASRPTDAGQNALAEAALAVYDHVDAMVPLIRQQCAEELKRQVDEWVYGYAYSPDDIVLGPFTQLDNDGYAALHKLLDIVRPGWREALQRRHDEAQARAAAIVRGVGARPLDTANTEEH